jgi:hypothetical protein
MVGGERLFPVAGASCKQDGCGSKRHTEYFCHADYRYALISQVLAALWQQDAALMCIFVWGHGCKLSPTDNHSKVIEKK